MVSARAATAQALSRPCRTWPGARHPSTRGRPAPPPPPPLSLATLSIRGRPALPPPPPLSLATHRRALLQTSDITVLIKKCIILCQFQNRSTQLHSKVQSQKLHFVAQMYSVATCDHNKKHKQEDGWAYTKTEKTEVRGKIQRRFRLPSAS